MHVSVIKEDLTEFIHAHPADDMSGDHGSLPLPIKVVRAHVDEPPGAMPGMVSEDEHVNITATFPTPGLYKVFAQFRPEGIELPQDEALMASFWIKVVEEGATPEASSSGAPTALGWWSKLFISLVLMVILSWAVSKYLKVKA